MRVRGDLSPNTVSIYPYGGDINNKVEVRLRENIKSYEEVYKVDGNETTVSGYEYDEYLFVLDKQDGLLEEITNNFDAWLATGRNLEVDTRATLYLQAKADAIDEYTQELLEGGLL